MKQVYHKPVLLAVKMQPSAIICASDWDTMNPGQPNQPAGSRRYGGFAWDDVEHDEE